MLYLSGKYKTKQRSQGHNSKHYLYSVAPGSAGRASAKKGKYYARYAKISDVIDKEKMETDRWKGNK